MKLIKMLFVVLMVLLLVSSITEAGDFDWVQDFNIKAEVDPSGFRARLGARFKIGNAEIEAVLSNVEKPASATIEAAEQPAGPPPITTQSYFEFINSDQ